MLRIHLLYFSTFWTFEKLSPVIATGRHWDMFASSPMPENVYFQKCSSFIFKKSLKKFKVLLSNFLGALFSLLSASKFIHNWASVPVVFKGFLSLLGRTLKISISRFIVSFKYKVTVSPFHLNIKSGADNNLHLPMTFAKVLTLSGKQRAENPLELTHNCRVRTCWVQTL